MEFLGKKGGGIKTLLQKNNITLEQLQEAQVDTDVASMYEHLKTSGAIKFLPGCDSWAWAAVGDPVEDTDVETHLLYTGVVVFEKESDKYYWVMDVKDWVKNRKGT